MAQHPRPARRAFRGNHGASVTERGKHGSEAANGPMRPPSASGGTGVDQGLFIAECGKEPPRPIISWASLWPDAVYAFSTHRARSWHDMTRTVRDAPNARHRAWRLPTAHPSLTIDLSSTRYVSHAGGPHRAPPPCPAADASGVLQPVHGAIHHAFTCPVRSSSDVRSEGQHLATRGLTHPSRA